MRPTVHGGEAVMARYRELISRIDATRGGRRTRGEGRQCDDDLVTIVTVAFNSAATIERTVESVAAQTHAHTEYVIVDGGSTDATVDILRRRSDEIDLWISGRDEGIGDAFNRGIALASGRYVALVNSDDWLEPTHIERAVEALRASNADFVFGDLLVHGRDGNLEFAIRGDSNYFRVIRRRMPDLNHPTVVCRADVFERCGLFDTRYRVAMDYDWLLRGYRMGVRGCYVEGLISHMDGNGVSHRNARRGLREVREISIKHGYPAALAWLGYMSRSFRLYVRELIERHISKRAALAIRGALHRRLRLRY